LATLRFWLAMSTGNDIRYFAISKDGEEDKTMRQVITYSLTELYLRQIMGFHSSHIFPLAHHGAGPDRTCGEREKSILGDGRVGRRVQYPEREKGRKIYLPEKSKAGLCGLWRPTFGFGRSEDLSQGFFPALGLFVKGLNGERLSGKIFLRRF